MNKKRQLAESMNNLKKTPVDEFISGSDREENTEAEALQKIVIKKKETRSRRLQLLIKPSTYDKVKQLAEADENANSVNDFINAVLEKL